MGDDPPLRGTDLSVLDRALPGVVAQHLAPPVQIAPPSRRTPHWSARSDAADSTRHDELTLDPASGAVVRRVDFAQKPLLDRLVGYGIAIHEGVLFPPLNQVLSAFTALGLITMCVSAATLWWRRRPLGHGAIGAPPHATGRRPRAMVALLVVLGILLPLLGASMLLVLATERWLLRRLPRAQRLLGLPGRSGTEPGHA